MSDTQKITQLETELKELKELFLLHFAKYHAKDIKEQEQVQIPTLKTREQEKEQDRLTLSDAQLLQKAKWLGQKLKPLGIDRRYSR